jgi:hypothetical protein
MRLRPVRGSEARGLVAGRVQHAGGLQYMLGGELLPRLAGDRLDQLSGHHVEHIVVGETATETRGRLQIAQPAHGLGPGQVGTGNEHQIALAQPESTAMHEKVADGHLARDPWVVHLEAR